MGVLLLRLDKMRINIEYNQYLTQEGITKLVNTYGFFNSFLGTDAEISLHTLIVKCYNDLLGRQISDRSGMKLHTSMLGTSLYTP